MPSPWKALGFSKGKRLKGKYGWREKTRTLWSRPPWALMPGGWHQQIQKGPFVGTCVREGACSPCIYTNDILSSRMGAFSSLPFWLTFYSLAPIIWKPNSWPSLQPNAVSPLDLRGMSSKLYSDERRKKMREEVSWGHHLTPHKYIISSSEFVTILLNNF